MMLTREDSDSYIINLQVDDALDDVSTEFSTPIKNCPSSDLLLPRTNRKGLSARNCLTCKPASSFRPPKRFLFA
jgi:hypothetical protein